MGGLRSPRFTRTANVAAIELTDRDREIIRVVHQHRFLRSTHILALVSGSPQQILRRLQLLFHYGYLERPQAQLNYYYKSGSRPIVYGLGNKGVELLDDEAGISAKERKWTQKNQAVERMFLEHALLVSDIMVSLEIACRTSGRVRLLSEDQIVSDAKPKPFKWRVTLAHDNIGVVPDRVFALEFPNSAGRPERAFFFLEADRGTMPVRRKSLAQSSMLRKLLAYEATWTHSLHIKRYGFHRFRVLTVTTNTARLSSLLSAASSLKTGNGLFLFADRSILENPAGILGAKWTRLGNESLISLTE